MFDLQNLRLNQLKNLDNIKASEFYSHLINDVTLRLEPIDKKYKNILIIDDEFELVSKPLRSIYDRTIFTVRDHDQLHTQLAEHFDLILFPFGLHWVNEVQLLLSQIKLLLKKDGIFMANFIGGGSLNLLRRLLIKLEIEANIGHTPHISPFIQFDHVVPLLQQAGFTENITDMEAFELEYESPLLLMKAMQKLGQSNALTGAVKYSITKKMYQALKHYSEDRFIDHINIITLLACPIKKGIKLKPEFYEISEGSTVKTEP